MHSDVLFPSCFIIMYKWYMVQYVDTDPLHPRDLKKKLYHRKGKNVWKMNLLVNSCKNVPCMFNMQISPPLCEKNVLGIYNLNLEIHE